MFHLCAKDTGDFRPVPCTFSTSEPIQSQTESIHIQASPSAAPHLKFFSRWKTHKWRRCQLVPWTVRQDSPGAQEACGPGMQVRGMEAPLSPSNRSIWGQSSVVPVLSSRFVSEAGRFSSRHRSLSEVCERHAASHAALPAALSGRLPAQQLVQVFPLHSGLHRGQDSQEGADG